jgi:CRISPR-associated protein Cmr4
MESKSIPIIGPYEFCDLVLIKTVSNLHPGIGKTGGIVDMPVQKDNLGFPIIYSSSIKGALKSILWDLQGVSKNIIKALFGPELEEGEKFTSAIAILDAFTLVFPVRSLEGVYAFATSPVLLKRFNRLLEMTKKDLPYIKDLSNLSINKGECQTSQNAVGLLNVEGMNKLVINEEIIVDYKLDYSDKIKELEKLCDIELGRLIILNDAEAISALERSLVRITRIALEREKKVIKEGGLWTEEYVPLDTIFATVFLYSKASYKAEEFQNSLQAGEVRNEFQNLIGKTNNYLIIGGNETIGKGIVKLRFI